MQAKKERRRRRRETNRNLKSWTEDAFVSGPEYFRKQNTNANTTTTQSKEEDGTSHDEDRMWRRLLKHARSSSEAARLRRAWEQWRTTMEASETEFHKTESSTSEFTAQQRGFGSNSTDSTSNNNKSNTHSNFKNGSNAGSNSHDWSTAWDEAFASSYSNLNTDYETFWSYGSDPRSQGAFSWQQRQRQQAGNAHPNWTKHTHRPVFALSKEVRSNLSLLGLATTHLPTHIELKTAFRTSAMVHHPDKHQGDQKAASTAEEKFKQVQAAFSFLKTMVVVVE